MIVQEQTTEYGVLALPGRHVRRESVHLPHPQREFDRVARVISAARTADEYLAQLPAERRSTMSAVRQLILRHLPAGYEEAMQYGMITYRIPLSRYPSTYNGQPLGIVALASQKQYMALYLMAVYADPAKERRLAEAFRRAGKRLDKGKSCIRFPSLDALPLEALGELIASTSVDDFIASYEASRKVAPQRRAAGKAPARKVATRKVAARETASAAAPKRKAKSQSTRTKKRSTS